MYIHFCMFEKRKKSYTINTQVWCCLYSYILEKFVNCYKNQTLLILIAAFLDMRASIVHGCQKRAQSSTVLGNPPITWHVV